MMRRFFTLFVLSCLFAGCASAPYDYSALENSKPRSILVIPPKNNTVEVIAPYIFLSTISKPLAEKGYYVFPVAVIDEFLRENGMPTPEEMNTIPLDKLHKHTNADAVLYVTINSWGQQYKVLSSEAVVNSNLRLLDARTGRLLWEARAYAVKQSGDGGGGLAGAIVGAIVEQVAGSLIDHTPQLSSQANHSAVNNRYRGLLPGPYAKPQ